MNQVELNALWNHYDDSVDYNKTLDNYRGELKSKKAKVISYGVGDEREGIDDFIDFLNKNRFIVLANPEFDGSDTYSWVIFPKGD